MKKNFYLQFMAALLFIFITGRATAQSVTLTKKRSPVLDVSPYQKVAVGDIVSANGTKTPRSMDLSDQLTSILFNARTLEVIDQNALHEILSAQRGSEIKAINESTTTELSKKMNSAIMILGRIQNDKIYSEEKSERQAVSINGCGYAYWWHLTGDITVQIKIMDIKTGKMLFSAPITQKVDINTKHDCSAYRLGDLDPILKDAITNLAKEIAKLVTPYDEYLTLNFENQEITIFKNPFKKLRHAAECLQNGDIPTGLTILKEYADDKSLKPSLQTKARFNYGLGLFVAEQYDISMQQLRDANLGGSPSALGMIKTVEDEKSAIRRREEMEAKAAEYKLKASQAPEAPPVVEKTAAPKKKTVKKNAIKSKQLN